MGACKSHEIEDTHIRLETAVDASKKYITISVIQGNILRDHVELPELEYDDTILIRVKFVDHTYIEPCDFIVFVANGNRTQNAKCLEQMPKDKDIYQLTHLPKTAIQFNSNIFLFVKLYLSAGSRFSLN